MAAHHHHDPGIHEEPALGRVYDARLVRRIVPFVRPQLPLLSLSLGLLLLVSGAQLVQPYVLKLVIDGPLAQGDPAGLLGLAILYASAALSEFGLRFVRSF